MFDKLFSKKPWTSEGKFEPLLESPTGEGPQPPYPRPKRSRCAISAGILLAVWTTALIIWNVSLIMPAPKFDPEQIKVDQPDVVISHCGNSTAEARALGCYYDTLAQSWIPQECADYETVEEYKTFNTWQGYTKEFGTERDLMTPEQMSEVTADGRYWIPPIDHAVHCVFTLKRMFKFQDRGVSAFQEVVLGEPLSTTLSRKEHHMTHCLSLLNNLSMGGERAAKDRDLTDWTSNRTVFSACLRKKAITKSK